MCDRRGEPQHGSKGDWHDAERLMQRLRRGDLRAVFHGSPHGATPKELARASPESGRGDDWLATLGDAGVRQRAATLYAELEGLHALRPAAKVALVGEARRDVAWSVLRSVPFLDVDDRLAGQAGHRRAPHVFNRDPMIADNSV